MELVASMIEEDQKIYAAVLNQYVLVVSNSMHG